MKSKAVDLTERICGSRGDSDIERNGLCTSRNTKRLVARTSAEHHSIPNKSHQSCPVHRHDQKKMRLFGAFTLSCPGTHPTFHCCSLTRSVAPSKVPGRHTHALNCHSEGLGPFPGYSEVRNCHTNGLGCFPGYTEV